MTSERLDPRRHVYRPDLAAEELRGKVEASRFAVGELHRVARAAVAMRREPDPKLGFDTELLFGEVVTVYDTSEGWAWVQAERDGYVGYVPANALDPNMVSATHRVSAIGTFLYDSADIKSPPLMHLSINAPLAVTETVDRLCRLATGGYVVARHVSLVGKAARDFVDVAERLIGVPYLWGGRTRVGLDCSGLVQLAMQAAGLACPRDSDMQEAALGKSVSLAGLQHGDLIFWKGHVAIARGRNSMIHANAFHMAVTIESVAEALARIGAAGSQVTSVRRLK
jgi:cell wall-associated NlpC family hydrolase